MNILNKLGLVTAEAHSNLETERDGLKRDLLAERLKFKNAARDLAALVEENEALKTDAEKLRSKRANDAALKREKRAAAKVLPVKCAA